MQPDTPAYDTPSRDIRSLDIRSQDTPAYDTLSNDTLSNDTLSPDTLDHRPLPKWLTDQKEGLTTIQPEKLVMREDHSLRISFVVTAIFLLVLVVSLTIYFVRKQKKQM
jgi:hypothetical protein